MDGAAAGVGAQTGHANPLRGDQAAFARNWRTVLAVDIGMAFAVLAGGFVMLASGTDWGWVLVVLGGIYVFFAVGRAVKWRRLRREAQA